MNELCLLTTLAPEMLSDWSHCHLKDENWLIGFIVILGSGCFTTLSPEVKGYLIGHMVILGMTCIWAI